MNYKSAKRVAVSTMTLRSTPTHFETLLFEKDINVFCIIIIVPYLLALIIISECSNMIILCTVW